MKTKTLTKITVGAIGQDISQALESVAKKYGIQLSYKGCRYSPTAATFKIEGAVFGDAGVAETRERQDWKRFSKTYGLEPEWLGETFVSDTGKYEITGLSTRKHKYPVLATNIRNGKRYKFPATMVRILMKSQKEA